MPEEEEEAPGITEQIENEIDILQRHIEVLEYILSQQGTTGITELSNELGYEHSRLRYSLRVLKEEQLIESTSTGIKITDRATNEIEDYNNDLEQIQSRIVDAGEQLGLEVNTEASREHAEARDEPLDQFVQTAPPEAVTDRFGSFDPLLKHEDAEIRESAVRRLLEIAEDESEYVTELTTVSAIADLLHSENSNITSSGLSLIRAIVDHDPGSGEPALPTLFERINKEDTPALLYKTIELFGEIAAAAPDTAQEMIEQRLGDVPNVDDEKRVDIVQSLNGVVAADNGVALLRPHTTSIMNLLDSANENVRIPVADTVRVLAENDAALLDDHRDRIVELLEDDSPRVREAAIEILTELTISTATLTRISQLAEEDPSEDVRETASDVLEGVPTPESESNTTGEVLVSAQIPATSEPISLRAADLSYDQFEFDDEKDLIGVGGQARVYRARVPDEDVTVALKQPSFDMTNPKEVYDRILTEARNWSRWDDHPHIVEVLDWGSTPGPWIALEYMDGGSLKEYIGTMGVEQRLWTTYAIASAVAHANTKGLAHHDIKPNNILFKETPDDQWDVPKVADWGLSREIIKATGSISQATPDYAAPEHFDALMPSSPVDERTDVYQLGVVCYELLTGTHPSHLSGDVPSPTDIDDSLPDRVDTLISTAITHDRDERFEHSLLFKKNIEGILSDEFPTLLEK